MKLEDQLKAEILAQYNSVMAFSTAIGVPYTTIVSMFNRGIRRAGTETVLKIFSALGVDPISLDEGELRKLKASVGMTADEAMLLQLYRSADYQSRVAILSIAYNRVSTTDEEV